MHFQIVWASTTWLLLGVHIVSSRRLLFPFGSCACDGVIPLNNKPYFLRLRQPFVFFNKKYRGLFYVDNGVISFRPFQSRIPRGALPSNYPAVIAVFHDDFVSRGSSILFARQSRRPRDLRRASRYVTQLFPHLSDMDPTSVVVVTWRQFPMFRGRSALNNTFQGVLVSSETASVVLMLYRKIVTNKYNTVVGVNAGDGIQFAEHPFSRTLDVLKLDTRAQARRRGLHGFIVYEKPKPASTYCIRNSSDLDLVNVSVTVRSNSSYYLQTLNTTAFDNGQRSEPLESRCRSVNSGLLANISFSVNVSNTDNPGCGVIFENGRINMTIEAVQQFGFYQGNDTIFKLSCNILPMESSLDFAVGDILSTTVPMVTGQSLSFRFQDRRDVQGSQIFTTDYAIVGRYIFPTICFERGLPYRLNVDPYGIFAHSCQLANNRQFDQDGDNEVMDVIDYNGYNLVDTDQIDSDETRRKRRVLRNYDMDEVTAVIQIKNIETNAVLVVKDCVDKIVAERVILSLLSSIVLVTTLTLVLFCYSEKQIQSNRMAQREKMLFAKEDLRHTSR